MILDGSRENQELDTTKKKYEKPSFRYEQVFETQALSCSKGPANSGCQPTKKS